MKIKLKVKICELETMIKMPKLSKQGCDGGIGLNDINHQH